MLPSRCLAAFVVAVLAPGAIQAAEPVTVDLYAETKVQFAVVTVGDIAQLSGGNVAIREQIARLDLADVKPREQTLTIKRQVVEYRLRIAGIDPAQVVITGADRITVSMYRRTVAPDEVVTAAKSELFRWLSVPRETVSVELARPVVVLLPEVPAGDPVTITAVPHAKSSVGVGRIQMDVVISTNGEKLLAIGVDLDVKPIGRSSDPTGQLPGAFAAANIAPGATPPYPVMQTAGTMPTNPATVPDMARPNSQFPTGTGVTQANPTPSSATTPINSRLSNRGGTVPTSPTTASAATPANPTTVLVQQRQRVMMTVRMGTLNVTAVGEAQQEGRLGQAILVQNVESKKTLTGRVTGPGTVEIEMESHEQ